MREPRSGKGMTNWIEIVLSSLVPDLQRQAVLHLLLQQLRNVLI